MRSLLTIFILLTCVFSFAQKKKTGDPFVKPLPVPHRAVNDFSKFLTTDGRQWLENELRAYHTRTSNAIVIITLDSLTDTKTKKAYTIEEAAMLYFNTWGIGDSKKNNGVLIMASRSPRGVRIEVGKGLEGILTDFVCKAIIDDVLVPNFKQGAFLKGMKEAVHAIENKLDSQDVDVQSAVSPPATPPPAQQQSTYDPQFRGVTSPGMGPELIVFGLFICFTIIIVYIARVMAKNNGGWYSGDGYRNRGLGFDDSYSGKEYKNAFSIFKISEWSSGSNSSSRAFGGSSSSASSGSSSSSSSSSSSGSYGGGSSSGGGASGNW
jgi:uncharacterized protein